MAEPLVPTFGLASLDHQVVDLVRGGDAAAFELLVDRYHAHLTRHLTYLARDPDLAADLAQDAFLDAFRNLDRFDAGRSFAAWLYGIANKRLLLHRRRQRVRRLVSLDWLAEAGAAPPVSLRQTDSTSSCDERDMVTLVLAALSPSLREALLLHSLDGFTAPEIAGILGISRTAAERRISRAKEQFRKRYDELNRDEAGTTHER